MGRGELMKICITLDTNVLIRIAMAYTTLDVVGLLKGISISFASKLRRRKILEFIIDKRVISEFSTQP